MSENDMLMKIFDLVQEKRTTEKPTRKKRGPMTPEQREKAMANLQKGRETSKRNRMASAQLKKDTSLKNKNVATEPKAAVEPEPPKVVVAVEPEPPKVVVEVEPEPPKVVRAPTPPPPRLVPSRPAPPPPSPKVSEPIKEEGAYVYSTYGGGSLW